MSEAFFPSHTSNGSQQVAGYPLQRTHDYGEPMTAPYSTIGGHPSGTYPSPPSGADVGSKRQRSRFLTIIAVLAVLTVGLGGYSVITHGSLGAAETKVADLTESLAEADDTLGTKQADLEKAQTDLETAQADLATSQQTLTAAATAVEAAVGCATALDQVFVALMNEDDAGMQAAMNASVEPCQAALGHSTF
jgi:hypothetical protein